MGRASIWSACCQHAWPTHIEDSESAGHVLLQIGALRALPTSRRAQQDGARNLPLLAAFHAVRELVQERLRGEAGEVILGHFLGMINLKSKIPNIAASARVCCVVNLFFTFFLLAFTSSSSALLLHPVLVSRSSPELNFYFIPAVGEEGR